MAASKENKYNIVQFDGEGFNNWSFRIKSVLKENMCLKAIQEEKYSGSEANTKMAGERELERPATGLSAR